ncbi:MAG: ABC transporter permease [Phycisphaeraceae bacterium]|nr:ABC transporter permease [Phycisphaerae bacterium]MBX3392393.1 ABC transporter permease [Phycisphaeraceae bacterium]
MIVFRILFQTVVLALGQVWANKFRAILTTLGIIIGVAAVVTVVAATGGLEKFVLKEFASIGASKVWVFPRMPPGQRDRYTWRQLRIQPTEVDGMLDRCPSLLSLTPVLEMSTSGQVGDVFKQVIAVQAVRPSWHQIEDRSVIQGRELSSIDDEQRQPVCIINDKAVAEFQLDTNCVGQRILLGGRAFMIVGVVETKTVSPMFGGDEARSEVFIPYQTGLMLRPEPRMYIIAQTRTPELHEDAKAEIRFYLRRMRGLGPDEPDTFGIEAIEQIVSGFKKIAAGLSVFLAGIVAISLLVGGIGIMNIMLVSVSERTREIGLRKAVGAKPAIILMQFLVEAVTLCLIGGAIGLAIGYAAVLAMKLTPSLEGASVPAWAVALSVGFSAGTGLVFGMFPAIKAARLDPIEALRHE